MKNKLVFLFLGIMFLLLAGCQAQNSRGPLSVEDAWILVLGNPQVGEPANDMQPATPGTGSPINTAAFLSISNSGTEADRLLRVESNLAETVELHLSEMKDGVMMMRPVEGIDLPAGATVELKPGGYHIMLINLKQELKPLEKYPLTLVFEKAGSLTIDAEALLP